MFLMDGLDLKVVRGVWKRLLIMDCGKMMEVLVFIGENDEGLKFGKVGKGNWLKEMGGLCWDLYRGR